MEDIKTLIKEKKNFLEIQKMLLRQGELVNSEVTATGQENKLGQALVDAGVQVTPQFTVEDCSFDFKIFHYPIIVEVDGGVHNELEKRQSDYRKDRKAQRRGFKVLRFTNHEVTDNLQGCIDEIKRTVQYVGAQPKEVWLYPLTIPEQIKAWLKKVLRGGKK